MIWPEIHAENLLNRGFNCFQKTFRSRKLWFTIMLLSSCQLIIVLTLLKEWIHLLQHRIWMHILKRVIGSIRRESLDHFLLFSEKQVRKIIRKYVEYYNYQRPHQGIDRIPDSEHVLGFGPIEKTSILGGLHHHYYRSSAWKWKKPYHEHQLHPSDR